MTPLRRFRNWARRKYNKRFSPKTILKPCKICGTQPEYKEVESKTGHKYDQIACPNCKYNIITYLKKKAYEVWNNGN